MIFVIALSAEDETDSRAVRGMSWSLVAPPRLFEHEAVASSRRTERVGSRGLAVPRWWRERAEPFALEQLREAERRAVLEIGADRLQPDGQLLGVEPGRERGCWQAAEDRDLRIEDQI